ncbi:DHHC palmitoyltransferase-domain-containing protein [Infundibulicybe gibba]|nr:DHHC palmitoyltransferase-domain-containing protein [Infundibulicybe gibba]
MICSRNVFRCFKTLERWGDRITGAAGPYFVALAVILITIGTISFFEVIAPNLSYPIISSPICLLIALNLHMHYYYVCTIKPGFVDDAPCEPGRSIFWAKRKSGSSRALTRGVTWTEGGTKITKAEVTQCRKCGQRRPERAHHCRICNRCVLKYDHHCPVRINQCVGVYNERHFVMFMAYLVLSTFFLCVLGYEQLFHALGITFKDWTYYTPMLAFVLIYILSGVLCFAVGIMLSFHLWGVACGETSVEAQDHEVYRKVAKSRDENFVNSYDLGKLKNLQLFFNLGENGYSWMTLVVPFRINPYTDGRAWARRDGYERHIGVRRGEELTDEDEDL